MLLPTTLEKGLPVNQCSHCNGIWISANQYLAWVKAGGPKGVKSAGTKSTLPVLDTEDVKICPECNCLMARYKVWPDISFRLDFCGQCNGVWFDRNEWEILVERGLHGMVNMFFSRPWQKRIRDVETRKVLDDVYQKKFGTENYARIKEIRAWLEKNPQRHRLLAFLNSRNPYGVSD
jgi:Zn-finger nucleic acid-binding protein